MAWARWQRDVTEALENTPGQGGARQHRLQRRCTEGGRHAQGALSPVSISRLRLLLAVCCAGLHSRSARPEGACSKERGPTARIHASMHMRRCLKWLWGGDGGGDDPPWPFAASSKLVQVPCRSRRCKTRPLQCRPSCCCWHDRVPWCSCCARHTAWVGAVMGRAEPTGVEQLAATSTTAGHAWVAVP